ncbi:MAG: hypothetical protein GVY23_04325 [Spirochaetes bacterium]|nr:hypothetical protein [Spirochaetota bacterium]
MPEQRTIETSFGALSERDAIAGKVSISVPPDSLGREIVGLNLYVDGRLEQKAGPLTDRVELETRRFSDGEHEVALGVRYAREETGALSLLRELPTMFVDTLVFDQSPPTPVDVEARAAEREWQVSWSASTDENFYAYIVQRYSEGPYGFQSIDTLYDRSTTSIVDDLPPVYGAEATYRVLTSNGVETTRSDAVATIFGTTRRAQQQAEPYYPAIPPRLRPGTDEVYSLTYGSVRAFDLATLKRKREALTPELLPGTDLEPVDMCFSLNGDRFYIRSRAFDRNSSQVLTPVNAVPLTTGTPEQLPISFPNRTVESRVATGPDGRVFIGTGDNKLLDVDGLTGEILNELDLPDGHTFTHARLSPDASTLYAVTSNRGYIQGSSAILAIDVGNEAFQELDRSFPADRPHLVGFEPGSQDLYVSVGSTQRTYRKYRARSAEDIGAISVPQGGRLVYTTDQHHYVAVDSQDINFPSTPTIVQYDADLTQAGPSWRVAAPFRAVSEDEAWLIFSDETSLWSISTAD